MIDPRNEKLADLLVNYSCSVKKGETVLVSIKGIPSLELGKAVIRKVTAVGGIPYWHYNDESLMRQFLLSASETQIKQFAAYHKGLIKKTNCLISIAGSSNPFNLSDIPPKTMQAFNTHFTMPLTFKYIINKAKWVVLRYPNDAIAQLAQQPQEVFEKFFYDVCCVNYRKMSKAMDSLVKLMKRTDRVHIKGKGTDLSFSIKGMNPIKCDGKNNIPDGEVFTAPIKNSVNGVVTHNTPSLYEGSLYSDIRLEFKNGKVIKANCTGNEKKLNKILDTDKGARYVGEFALGVNPMIKEPMKDTLFDEKIDGSFHFTPGRCYDEAPNGNKSAIHWDMVSIQRNDYGGGEIWFDDRLIRKNGKFVIPGLKGKFTVAALGGK